MCSSSPPASEYRFQIRHVGIDVRRQHRDLACLQRWVETWVLQQAAQLVVQHLQLAQAGMAGMHLQAGIVAAQSLAQRARGQRTAVEQIALEAMQQAVGQSTFVQGWPGVFLRIGIGGDLAGRVHHLVAAQHRHEIAAGRPQASNRRFSPAASPNGSGAPLRNRSASVCRSPQYDCTGVGM